jgi:hypothetical protein
VSGTSGDGLLRVDPSSFLGADVFLVFERMPTDLEKVVNSNQFFTAEHALRAAPSGRRKEMKKPLS